MKILKVPFSTIDWSGVSETIHPGETGQAIWKTVEKGNIRVRMVTYSANYLADHWCPRGHVIHILSGTMVSELKNGGKTIMNAGMTYMMSDDPENPHRSFTESGVTLFIVD